LVGWSGQEEEAQERLLRVDHTVVYFGGFRGHTPGVKG